MACADVCIDSLVQSDHQSTPQRIQQQVGQSDGTRVNRPNALCLINICDRLIYHDADKNVQLL